MPRFPTAHVAALALLVGIGVAPARAAEPSIAVSGAWARATPPGVPNAAVYLEIRNTGADDVLLAAHTPAAQNSQLHTHVAENDVMRMTQLHEVPAPSGATVELAPGGMHVMLLGIGAPLSPGDAFTLTLTFRDAGDIEVVVPVRDGRPARHTRRRE